MSYDRVLVRDASRPDNIALTHVQEADLVIVKKPDGEYLIVKDRFASADRIVDRTEYDTLVASAKNVTYC